MTTPPLKWGILSTAKITQKILPFLQTDFSSQVVAIASRDLQKAQEFAKKWQIPICYGSYEELLTNPDIDIVYIPLPNHLHFAWSKNSLLAGKHVLCEKPLTMDFHQATELQKLATERGLILSEGFMFRYHEQCHFLKSFLKKSDSKIKHIRCRFHSILPNDPQNIRLQKNAGGGVQWDIGCYAVNVIRFLFEEMPITVQAWSKMGSTHVAEYFSAIFEFSNSRTAQLDCSFVGPRQEGLEIEIEGGWVSVPKPFKPSAKEIITTSFHHKIEQHEILDPMDPYQKEILYFEKIIRQHVPPVMTLNESVEISCILNSMIESAKQGRPVQVLNNG